MKIKRQISSVYQNLLPSEIIEFSLNETLANCDQCSMSPHKYKAHLKCCTFEPLIPNFQAGAILLTEESLQGPQVITKKIEQRKFAIPLGLLPTPAYQKYFVQKKETDFGQNENWLCPYFDRQKHNCSIWRDRGSVCTSFFCQSSYGVEGEKFWQLFQNYFHEVEMALMQECLVMMDFSPRQVDMNLALLQFGTGAHEINQWSGVSAEKLLRSDTMPMEMAIELWNGYFDDQVGFYKKCYQIVKQMTSSSLQETLGEKGAMMYEELSQQKKRIEERL